MCSPEHWMPVCLGLSHAAAAQGPCREGRCRRGRHAARHAALLGYNTSGKSLGQLA